MEPLTRSELLAELGSRYELATALKTGTYRRVLRGVYVAGSAADDLNLRARAAAKVLPHGAVLADRCLLWVLGVDVLPPGTPSVECVVARGAVVPRRAGVRVREACLPPDDTVILRPSGLLALRPARAVVDLLRMLPMTEALVVADAVLRATLVVREQLLAELSRHRALRGVVQARWAVSSADPRAESPPESRLRALLLEAGLAPVPQVEVRTSAGLFRVDMAFPSLRIAIEYDGREVHDQSAAFTSDRQRQNALIAAGWTVLRFSAADLWHSNRASTVAVVLAAAETQARRTA